MPMTSSWRLIFNRPHGLFYMNLNAIKKLRDDLNANRYKCKIWCYECCTIVPMSEQELKLMRKELLKNWYTDLPKWKWDDYCHFLTSDWKCSVYNQRPIICRSFSDIGWKFTKKWRSVVTQSCTYWEKKIVQATADFMRYIEHINENWIVMENAEHIVEIAKHPIPIS